MWRLTLFTAILIGGHAAGAQDMSEYDIVLQQFEKFKSRLGVQIFDQAAGSIDPTKGVFVEWPENPLVFLPGGHKGWSVVGDATYPEGTGMVERDWTLKKADLRIRLRVFVSSTGPKPALDQLLGLGITSNMPDPYRLGPKDIGQISATDNALTPALISSVFWVNHNVCVDLDNDDNSIDTLALARRIDQFLNQHLVSKVADHRSVIEKVMVTPREPRVGESFWIELQPSAKFDPKHLLMELESSAEPYVDQREEKGFAWRIAVKHPGLVDIPFWIADKKTLLSTRVLTKVNVLPVQATPSAP